MPSRQQESFLWPGLRPERLLDANRLQDAWGRYQLKIAVQDSLLGALRSLVYIPFGFLRRRRYPTSTI